MWIGNFCYLLFDVVVLWCCWSLSKHIHHIFAVTVIITATRQRHWPQNATIESFKKFHSNSSSANLHCVLSQTLQAANNYNSRMIILIICYLNKENSNYVLLLMHSNAIGQERTERIERRECKMGKWWPHDEQRSVIYKINVKSEELWWCWLMCDVFKSNGQLKKKKTTKTKHLLHVNVYRTQTSKIVCDTNEFCSWFIPPPLLHF